MLQHLEQDLIYTTSIKDFENCFKNKIKLHQNFPNPFNSTTKIKYEINKSGPLSITIYDLNGKEVVKLKENQFLKPGLHSVTWNGKNKNGKEVSSGIYMYQLITDGFSETRKFLFIK